MIAAMRLIVLALAACVLVIATIGYGSSSATIFRPSCKGERATIWTPDEDGVYRGTPGEDVIVAGPGDDEIYADADLAIPFQRGQADLVCAGGGNDRISGVGGRDRLDGEEGDDTIIGGDGGDRLEGGDGDDQIDGNGDSDKISGGPGKDGCSGGAGRDSCDGGAPRPRRSVLDPDICSRNVERRRSCQNALDFPLRYVGSFSGNASIEGEAETWSASDVVFTLETVRPGNTEDNADYKLRSGRFSWRLTGESCSGAEEFNLSAGGGMATVGSDPERYWLIAGGGPDLTRTCVDDYGEQYVDDDYPAYGKLAPWVNTGGPKRVDLSSRRIRDFEADLTGSVRGEGSDGYQVYWEWSFRPEE